MHAVPIVPSATVQTIVRQLLLNAGLPATKITTAGTQNNAKALGVRNEPGRRFRTSGQLPSDDIKIRVRLRSIRIVEALSVKVLRKYRVVCALPHESP